jgi:hypothetical protein
MHVFTDIEKRLYVIEEKEDTMDIQLLRRCPGWKRKEKDKIEGSYFISHW